MAQDKKIEQYLHLYLGCECIRPSDGHKLTLKPITLELAYIDNWQPILRPLSDMSEEEKRELYAMGSQRYEGGILQMLNLNCFDSYQFLYLLSKHFDLFNLHEAGLCLYKTDLK